MDFMQHDAAAHFDKGETYEPEFPYSHSSQEHFCPSHLVSGVGGFVPALHLFAIYQAL